MSTYEKSQSGSVTESGVTVDATLTTEFSYSYDANGLRAGKSKQVTVVYYSDILGREITLTTDTPTSYQYAGDKLVYQVTTDTDGEVGKELYFFYDSNDNLAYIKFYDGGSAVGNYFVTTNLQGDVLGLYNSSGTLVASYEYDAWGNCEIVSDTSGVNIASTNPIRYRGYYYDSDTGLYYLQSRYYDAEIGRFINADGFLTTDILDPIAYNMFAYCNNNPVMYSDPSGCSLVFSLVLLGLAVGSLLVLGSCSSGTKTPSSTSVPPSNNTKPNPTIPNDGFSSTGDLTDDQMHDNAEIIYDTLSQKGWSLNAICAVLGNAQLESVTINPGRWQNGGGPGYGIVQWDPATKYLNSSYAQVYGAASLIGQIEYLNYSMQPGNGEWFCNPSYSNYYLDYNSFISSTASVDYLTEVFLWSYERPGTAYRNERVAYAQYWYSYFS